MVKRLAPLLLVVALFGFFAWRLAAPAGEPSISSQLVGRQAPDLTLEAVLDDKSSIESFATGEPRLVNLFGSWCVPCIGEAPQLERLAAAGIAIDGIAVRDEPDAVAEFLADHGDPFERIGGDPESEASFAFGATGVPETFLLDGTGVVRAHWQGPIEADDVASIIEKVEALR